MATIKFESMPLSSVKRLIQNRPDLQKVLAEQLGLSHPLVDSTPKPQIKKIGSKLET
jgi:hypothetical protein